MQRMYAAAIGVALIVVAFIVPLVVGLQFADDADGEEQAVQSRGNRGTQIAVLSSSPDVTLNLSLGLSPDEWSLDLSPETPSEFRRGGLPQDLDALIVLAEGWHTNDQQLLPPYVEPTALEVATRSDADALWMEGVNDLQLILVSFTLDNDHYQSVRLQLDPPDGVRRTPTGQRLFVPEFGRPTLFCDQQPCGVAGDDFGTMVEGEEARWFGGDVAASDGFVQAELSLGGDWHLGATHPTPRATDDGRQYWTDDDAGLLRGMNVELLSNEVAHASQRKFLWAGVLFGIAGSVVAAVLVAVAGWVMKRGLDAGAPSERKRSGVERSSDERPTSPERTSVRSGPETDVTSE